MKRLCFNLKTSISKDVTNKLQKKAVKSLMDVIMLAELKNRSMTGYDMIISVNRKFGIIISSGTVYSHLYALERDETVSTVQSNGKRTYALTEKGVEHLKLSFNLIKKTLNSIEQEITA